MSPASPPGIRDISDLDYLEPPVDSPHHFELRQRRCKGPCPNDGGHRWIGANVDHISDPRSGGAVLCRFCLHIANGEASPRLYYCIVKGCHKYQICNDCKIYTRDSCGNGKKGHPDAKPETDELWSDKRVPLPESDFPDNVHTVSNDEDVNQDDSDDTGSDHDSVDSALAYR